MTLFVDSSDVGEIGSLFTWGEVFEGVTTNPVLLSGTRAHVEERIRSIAAVSRGPISVEIAKSDTPTMLAQAEDVSAMHQRVVVKVPFCEAGLYVLQTHRTNATCVMSFAQAVLAIEAGANYVSIFFGRVKDMGYDPLREIERTRRWLDRTDLTAEIIVGSIRHMTDIADALDAGAHIVTAPPSILRKMLWNPQTERTIEEFDAAGRSTSP